MEKDIIDLNDTESVERKILDLEYENAHLGRMIEENNLKISENDDTEARAFLNENLKAQMDLNYEKISKLYGSPTREEGQELMNDLEEAYLLLYGE